VYAHVPAINDFTDGIKTVLNPGGTVTLEFPHLMRLIEQCQFDTVYHEHFSYLSLHTVSQVFRRAGLRVLDVEQLPTHGGSLRVYGCHADDPRSTADAVGDLLAQEGRAGLRDLGVYRAFQANADAVKDDLTGFLIEQKRRGKKVAGYGAAAKGNTLLNYAGIRPDLLPFICDAAPSKQGKFTPGGHIPIVSVDVLPRLLPDVVLILPWNIADEVTNQLRQVHEWGGKFAVAIPELRTM
ncbi:MAG TPA: class I SAM-dependent methyltransferase, partial [Ramlibacter sp.]|nr:class I SAM-dependent methyltransferase [Ramlibacter sp.]